MPMSRAVTPAHSTSLRNPCPDGTGIGTGDFNGTILLICDAAFYKSSTISLTYEESLGLGLGLGIPVFLGLLFILTLFYNACKQDRIGTQQPQAQIKPYVETTLKAEEVLTPSACTDFCTDNLSETLKRELMILRVQKGRDLNELVKEAVQKNSLLVARWIGHLYPGDIPLEIRQAATAAPIRVSSQL
jgi:hypothetical protein